MRDINMNSIRSINRAIDILSVFTLERPSLTIEQVASASNLPKATVYRILYTLEQQGLIRYNPKTLEYQLGLKLLEFSGIITALLDVRKEAEDELLDLQVRTQQTVLMAIPENETMVYVYIRENPIGLKYSPSYIGQRRDFTYGVLGRIMMAFMPEEKLDQILEKYTFPQRTVKTITDKNLIRKNLEHIKKNLLGVEFDETAIGATGIASPVFDVDGRLTAAIGIIGPSVQLVDENLESATYLVRTSAANISAKMGYKGAGF